MLRSSDGARELEVGGVNEALSSNRGSRCRRCWCGRPVSGKQPRRNRVLEYLFAWSFPELTEIQKLARLWRVVVLCDAVLCRWLRVEAFALTLQVAARPEKLSIALSSPSDVCVLEFIVRRLPVTMFHVKHGGGCRGWDVLHCYVNYQAKTRDRVRHTDSFEDIAGSGPNAPSALLLMRSRHARERSSS